MHEMSIAQSLVEILQEEMSKHRARELRSVRLHVGRMSAVVPEALSFCFQVMTQGTDMEGARLIMEEIPVRANCRKCGRISEIVDYDFHCPRCGASEMDIVTGQGLSIVELEVGR